MSAAILAREWLSGFEPAPDLIVSQWAEQHRRLPEVSAARGGRWRNEVTPYLRGIMDATIERGVRQIAVCKAAQCGASEALLNIVLFHIHARPCPMLMVMPTASAAAAWSKERLADALRSIPELRRLVSDKRLPAAEGRPESTLSLKMFPAGFLALGGGNSPNSYARWSARLAIADDCDRIPRFIGAEGDATQLLGNRVTTFHDGFAVWVSTPVLSGGRIETLCAHGDRRRYFLPCLACGRWDYVTWADAAHWRVAFDDRDPATARLACPCGATVREPERMDRVRAGEWRPTADPLVAGFVSFHLPAMLSPFVTLAGLVTKFLSAHMSGPLRLREFVTTQLAEGWKDPATAIDPADLMLRMEDF
jgi:phage terminase large subunit GpA-like protein